MYSIKKLHIYTQNCIFYFIRRYSAVAKTLDFCLEDSHSRQIMALNVNGLRYSLYPSWMPSSRSWNFQSPGYRTSGYPTPWFDWESKLRDSLKIPTSFWQPIFSRKCRNSFIETSIEQLIFYRTEIENKITSLSTSSKLQIPKFP